MENMQIALFSCEARRHHHYYYCVFTSNLRFIAHWQGKERVVRSSGEVEPLSKEMWSIGQDLQRLRAVDQEQLHRRYQPIG